MFCSKCGSQAEGSFCSNCGTAQNRAAADYAPGKNYLMTAGILFIIVGIFAAMGAISGLSITEALVRLTGIENIGVWRIYYTWSVLAGFYAVIIGIMGISNRENKDKAGILIIFAAIVIISLVSRYMFSAISGLLDELGATILLFLPFDLILPILYIAGANKNRNAAPEMQK